MFLKLKKTYLPMGKILIR